MNIIEQKLETLSSLLGGIGTYKKEESIFADEIATYSVQPVPQTYQINITGLDKETKSKIVSLLSSDEDLTCELLESTDDLIRVKLEEVDKLEQLTNNMVNSYAATMYNYGSDLLDKLREK